MVCVLGTLVVVSVVVGGVVVVVGGVVVVVGGVVVVVGGVEVVVGGVVVVVGGVVVVIVVVVVGVVVVEVEVVVVVDVVGTGVGSSPKQSTQRATICSGVSTTMVAIPSLSTSTEVAQLLIMLQ